MIGFMCLFSVTNLTCYCCLQDASKNESCLWVLLQVEDTRKWHCRRGTDSRPLALEVRFLSEKP